MFFTLGGVCMPPYVCTPPYIHMPPGVYTPPYVPHTPMHLYVLRGFCMLWGVVRGPLHVGHFPYTSPVWGASPSVAPPSRFQGYWYDIWGIFPSVGVWGVFPSVGASAYVMSICSFMYIFVVFMSHISTMAITTTLPVMVVSSDLSLVSSVTMASSLMGFPVSLDQLGVVQPPP